MLCVIVNREVIEKMGRHGGLKILHFINNLGIVGT